MTLCQLCCSIALLSAATAALGQDLQSDLRPDPFEAYGLGNQPLNSGAAAFQPASSTSSYIVEEDPDEAGYLYRTGGSIDSWYAPLVLPTGAPVTRGQLANLYASLSGVSYQPPACVAGQEMFSDVPASHPFCRWIEELARRGITSGCTATQYCPSAAVTRAQMDGADERQGRS